MLGQPSVKAAFQTLTASCPSGLNLSTRLQCCELNEGLTGTCHCGSCMCDNNDDKGLVTGRFCECDDSECLDEDTGEVCGGRLHSQLLLIPYSLS
ncbi:hypothetical protein GOODEAATRI_007353 [Goodea atripinnis]|uniref:Metallothionein n=1 Tax=Goodea atripinnis TaxID=208336 RepID=A0ABV0PCD1_9TELE